MAGTIKVVETSCEIVWRMEIDSGYPCDRSMGRESSKRARAVARAEQRATYIEDRLIMRVTELESRTDHHIKHSHQVI